MSHPIKEQLRHTPRHPLRLKRVLLTHRIPQETLRQVLIQEGGASAGRAMSAAALSQLINRGEWPALTSPETIQQQTHALLVGQGVPEAALADLWEVDDHPLGVAAQTSKPTAPAGARANGSGQGDLDDSLEAIMLSESAKRKFHILADPFLDDVQGPGDVFLSSGQRYVKEAMWQACNHGGFIAVVGESGAGKSVLRRDLVDRIAREKHPITLVQPFSVDKSALTASAISEAIVSACSMEPPRRTIEARDRQVARVLTDSSRAGNRHVLLIEEAHDLTISTLKKLKRYWELEDGFRRLLAIVLVGQPELRHMLDERVNWEAREVIRRCEVAELEPLDEATGAYLALKFKRLDIDPGQIYAPDVPDAIRARLTQTERHTQRAVSQCFPLSVNNLLKRGMNLAAEVGEDRVTVEIIRSI